MTSAPRPAGAGYSKRPRSRCGTGSRRSGTAGTGRRPGRAQAAPPVARRRRRQAERRVLGRGQRFPFRPSDARTGSAAHRPPAPDAPRVRGRRRDMGGLRRQARPDGRHRRGVRHRRRGAVSVGAVPRRPPAAGRGRLDPRAGARRPVGPGVRGVRVPSRPPLSHQAAAGRRAGGRRAPRPRSARPFAVDFVVVREKGRWQPYAIEINLGKGGTTQPFLTCSTSSWTHARDCYRTRAGEPRYYMDTDNLHESLRGPEPPRPRRRRGRARAIHLTQSPRAPHQAQHGLQRARAAFPVEDLDGPGVQPRARLRSAAMPAGPASDSRRGARPDRLRAPPAGSEENA